MPARYASLPSHPQSGEGDVDELEAAFEASDDEDEEFHDARSEYRPLNPEDTSTRSVTYPLSNGAGAESYSSGGDGRHTRSQSTAATTGALGGYDFENINNYDYAYQPPPGEPPRQDRALLNNTWGNSNGVIPEFSAASLPQASRIRGWDWMKRILPTRFGGAERRGRVYGGGQQNDGVFANVMAKPTAPVAVPEGEDGTYVMPEDAQKDAPPSYASAQADAVPPYWETTIHAPSSLSPGNMLPGELPIDGLATGTLFSFLWNMLVSISFQFVGFLLTYLMHTTHAAKLGSRAGLGLTLVQYGFALRASDDQSTTSGDGDAGIYSDGGLELSSPPAVPSFSSSAEADIWFASHPNATVLPGGTIDPGTGEVINGNVMGDMTTEWLAFLLMTIGWFILLNSLLGFWRIKRWEKSILDSHQPPSSSSPNTLNDAPSASQPPFPHHRTTSSFSYPRNTSHPFASHFERTFGLRFPTASMFRQGLTFDYPGSARSSRHGAFDGLDGVGDDGERTANDSESGRGTQRDSQDGDLLVPAEDEMIALFPGIPPDHPDRPRLIAEAVENERRLQRDLRAAGLL